MADDNAVAVPLAVKTSDLPVRTASALVMLAVAGGALLLGGVWLDAFIASVAIATLVEFVLLLLRATKSPSYRIAAIAAGAGYIGLAAAFLIRARGDGVLTMVGAVIAVDTFAYFAGRTFGGPKIAPSISPSKTWAGLVGGIVGASLAILAFSRLYATPLCQWYFDAWDSLEPPLPPGTFSFDDRCHIAAAPFDMALLGQALLVGAMVAVAAQSGDFLESWLKRKAGVKDSSRLIPGHGGVFDRTDGLIAVAFLAGAVGMLIA